jgi:hypothetical protein
MSELVHILTGRSIQTQSNVVGALLGSIGAVTGFTDRLGITQDPNSKAAKEMQEAMNSANITMAQLGNDGLRIQADAAKYGWDAQKIIQQMQTAGIISQSDAQKAIARAQQNAAMYGAVANIKASNVALENARIAGQNTRLNIVYISSAMAILLVIGLATFTYFKPKLTR